MNNEKIIALRMKRQFLTERADEQEYLQLYRDTEPGQNVYWHGFGQPPVLSFRADFDDMEFNRQRQLDRRLLKGRFQGGNLGWIDARDMELFACMCKKPMDKMTEAHEQILELIRRDGPMNIQQMKEVTGMLVKQITPILHRLQEAFLIYEDQTDGEWDRGWYRFDEMFPDVDLNKYTRTQALKIVLSRFAYRMVWFDKNMAKSFYKLPAKDISTAISELCAEGVLTETGGGYVFTEDVAEIEGCTEKPPRFTLVMHRNDILIKAYEHIVKEKYKSEYELLQLIIIDGEIHGAVQGKFKYGPYIIENIAVDSDYVSRRDEIINAVKKENPDSDILRFNGQKM